MSSLNWSYGEQAIKPVWKQNHKSIDADSNVISNFLSNAMLPLVFVISCGNYENSTLTMEKKIKEIQLDAILSCLGLSFRNLRVVNNKN